MDRSLDDVISERQRNSSRNQRDRRQNWPRDGVRKSVREEPRNLDRDWVHDRYDDDPESRRPARNQRSERFERDRYASNGDQSAQSGAKLRVDNLHYDLTEDDIKELFTRIGPIQSAQLLYDRQDRSRGTAYVTYVELRDARAAIREFDGANANGQPIQLTLMAQSTAAPRPTRNPFDTAVPPSRSLIERIESPMGRAGSNHHNGNRRNGRRSDRSASPADLRRSDVSKPAPEHIDRYVPGQRSPRRRGGMGSSAPRDSSGRRPGALREQSGGQRRDDQGRMAVQGRPRKTVQELDAEMADYWGDKDDVGAGNGAPLKAGAAAAALDEDIDMIQ